MLAAGCGSSSATAPSGTTPSTTTVYYSGTFVLADGKQAGTVTVSAAVSSLLTFKTGTTRPLAISAAVGVLKLRDGTSIDMTGTYDSVTGRWDLRGGEWTVSFFTTPGTAAATGQVTVNLGVGTLSVVQVPANTPAPVLYCGAFNATNTSGKGVMTMSVSGNLITGLATDSFATVAFSGALTGTSLSATYKYGGGQTGGGTVSGTVTGTTAQGTWTNTDGEFGVWSASTASCS